MDRRYLVKEMFGPTLQGEGAHAGRPCVFLRFAACNLECPGCDTDFSPEGAVRYTAPEIVARLVELDAHRARMVVVTGGEPTLQYDAPLADALHAAGFRVHMESNGTRAPQGKVDWLTVSPKPQYHPSGLLLASDVAPNELKVVIDDHTDASTLARYEAQYPCEHYFAQAWMDDHYREHLAKAIALVQERPRWRLSVQMHKVIGVP
ncbi:MAG: radical SAM protein [Deltaproteobacteria bacterium]|nr:radical SAM protein [Deltaproteobacteria bacterium]